METLPGYQALRTQLESKNRQLLAVRQGRKEMEALEITLQRESDAITEYLRTGMVAPTTIEFYSEMDDVTGFGKEF